MVGAERKFKVDDNALPRWAQSVVSDPLDQPKPILKKKPEEAPVSSLFNADDSDDDDMSGIFDASLAKVEKGTFQIENNAA